MLLNDNKMSLVANKSTSALCGSRYTSKYSYHSDAQGSEPRSHYLPRFDRAERFTGSNQAVCKTEAEFKASKLNRTEQVKLQNLKNQVSRAKAIKNRQYQHIENSLRVQSARLATRKKGIENNWTLSHQNVSVNNTFLHRQNHPGSELVVPKCNTCVQLKTIVEIYEKESREHGMIDDAEIHSTCMFSNGQIDTFLKMLEAKYIEEIPGLKTKLRNTDATSVFMRTKHGPKLSRRQVDLSLTSKDTEVRIRQFCCDLERFNKRHGGVSTHIRETVERIRLSNAVVKRDEMVPKRLDIREEVKRILKL